MNAAYATRYLAAVSAIACAGFSALGAVQALRYTPQLYRVGVPIRLTMPVALGAHALGEPMRQWSVGAHVEVLKAVPRSVRYAAIELYNPQLLVPKTQTPAPVGANLCARQAQLQRGGPAPRRLGVPGDLAGLFVPGALVLPGEAGR